MDRARGALVGLAMGDALGMPTQTLTRGEIAQRHGRIEGFEAPHPDHPFAGGLPAGRVTDDTEQALLLARRLMAEPGRFDARAWARDLTGWEADMRRRGLRDLLGPSSKAALEAIARGVDPAEAGRGGTTNGAAMRIAPVGIAAAPRPVSRLVDMVETAARATHNTGEAIAAASAVAAAVSAGVEGIGAAQALERALEAAREGQGRGHAAGEPDMAGRILRAVEIARAGPTEDAFAEAIGTSVASRESVPAAFGLLVLAGGDTWRALLMAANIGDDTDTIGAMAGAMGGAVAGERGLPARELEALRAANEMDVTRIAEGLLALRDGVEVAT